MFALQHGHLLLSAVDLVPEQLLEHLALGFHLPRSEHRKVDSVVLARGCIFLELLETFLGNCPAATCNNLVHDLFHSELVTCREL